MNCKHHSERFSHARRRGAFQQREIRAPAHARPPRTRWRRRCSLSWTQNSNNYLRTGWAAAHRVWPQFPSRLHRPSPWNCASCASSWPPPPLPSFRQSPSPHTLLIAARDTSSRRRPFPCFAQDEGRRGSAGEGFHASGTTRQPHREREMTRRHSSFWPCARQWGGRALIARRCIPRTSA